MQSVSQHRANEASNQSDWGSALRKRLKVLVVDDLRDNADTLAALIESHGHATRTAYSARDGMVIAYEWTPTLIFQDLAMPGMSGIEAVRILRADKLFQNTTIVALSAYVGQTDAMTRYRGFDRLVAKPISGAELCEILQTAADPPDREGL